MFSKFSGGADAAGPGSHFGNQALRHAVLLGRFQSTSSIKRVNHLTQGEEWIL